MHKNIYNITGGKMKSIINLETVRERERESYILEN